MPSELYLRRLLSGPSSDGVALVRAADLDGEGDEDLVIGSLTTSASSGSRHSRAVAWAPRV